MNTYKKKSCRENSSRLIYAMMIVMLVCGAAFAIPTIKITTLDGKDPPSGSSESKAEGGQDNYGFKYVSMSKFEITGATNSNFNMVRNSPPDSIRQRGNSTSQAVKKPYRIKFDKKVSLFGKEPAKSWVLLANHYDNTFALNALAFRVGHILGLEFTNSFEFVNLELNGKHKGIYLLTEQIQVNKGRVDIDEDKGWLVELNFHNPDKNDIMFRGNPYDSLKVFVKSPEIDDKDYKNSDISSYPQLAFVRDEFNAAMRAVSSSAQFNAGAHRDLIDLTSYAKYLFVQQFMANAEFANGDIGSNFAYKDAGGRIKAGPLWDFDLATVTITFGISYFQNQRLRIETHPTRKPHAFYTKLFEDEVFRARYRKIWEENKSQIQALSASGGFIDSIATLLTNDISNNYNAHPSGNRSGPRDATAHNQEITKLKKWWDDRYSHWNTQIASGTRFDASKDVPDNIIIPPEKEDVTLTVTRTPEAGGNVTVKVGAANTQTNPGSLTFAYDTEITITAQPNEGWRFKEWTSTNMPGTLNNNKTSLTHTWKNSSTRTITAVFEQSGVINPNDPIKIEAENYTSVTGSGIQITADNNNNGIQRISHMQNGNTAVYNNVNVAAAGPYILEFRASSSQSQQFSFTVTVNGQQAGTVTGVTGSSSTYTTVTLLPAVNLNQGNNTITLTFSGAMHLDYFTAAGGTTSVNYGSVKPTRTKVTLRANAGGLYAALPPNHGYTSYRLIDLRGREIRRGKIGAGTSDLRFNNIGNGVVFLKLTGNNGSAVLRAVPIQ